MTYYPRRPVTSFHDLEVYQKLLAIAVVVVKHVPPDASNQVVQQLHDVVLALPVKVGQAHSLRFSHTVTAIETLEEILMGCNQTIVYLELYRDLFEKKRGEEASNNSQTAEFYEDLIKNIMSTRFKVLHLQRSWQKFTPQAPLPPAAKKKPQT